MTVEDVIKALAKIPNQQLPVFFEIGKDMPAMEGIAVPVKSISEKPVLMLDGQRKAVIIEGEPV